MLGNGLKEILIYLIGKEKIMIKYINKPNKINPADRCAPADLFVEPVEKVIFSS